MSSFKRHSESFARSLGASVQQRCVLCASMSQYAGGWVTAAVVLLAETVCPIVALDEHSNVDTMAINAARTNKFFEVSISASFNLPIELQQPDNQSRLGTRTSELK
jgi:hypothetical protein